MPPKKKQKKLLILIILSQLCLRSLTRIVQVNLFQRPRIPRPKIIPSRTPRLLKSHARQILVSLAKKSQCWSGRSPKIEECMNWKKNWSKLLSLSTEFEADFIHFSICAESYQYQQFFFKPVPDFFYWGLYCGIPELFILTLSTFSECQWCQTLKF